MNKMLKGLLVSLLAVSAAQVDAHTNKTFLLPRSQGVQLPMQYTTFHELVGRKAEDKFGGNFAVTGFYSHSANESETAEYFLVKDKSKITLNALSTAAAGNVGGLTSAGNDVDLFYIIHNRDRTDVQAAAEAGTTTIALDPEHSFYGVRFDYHQDLDKILKGLYLCASLPIVHVENDPELSVVSNGTLPAANLAAGADTSLKNNLEKYFRGEFENTQANNLQAKLTNAKIVSSDETGVADIDIALGYKFLNKEKYHAALAIAVTIPTGDEADGVTMFEALVGNGKHFGLGGDFCAGARVWGDMDHNIKVMLKMKYRYLFENSEKRTLGIKGRNFGQYFLLGKRDAAGAKQLIPAANVTTLNVDVTPGSQFDGVLAFAYNNGGFCFDLGYNMYFREDEDVELKDTFETGLYTIAARSADTANAFANPIVAANNITDGNAAAGAASILSKDSLDLGTASTPSQFTHTIFTALGFTFKEWDNPLMLGVGGKYEFASENSALDMWGIWAKLGIGF